MIDAGGVLAIANFGLELGVDGVLANALFGIMLHSGSENSFSPYGAGFRRYAWAPGVNSRFPD